ncbi:hypothetical protein ATANTOWER_007269 [Ataeniobius toweri]|uniref:Immunoglobulin V-set domain-containing protein n=1 Tax=Ataeniobius toweri TaxID=208326 RepID=A0ABU7AMQ4_9TELE|nr:hypothetical protein [Ataeniobius toweri]
MFQGQKMLIFFICFSCNTLLISGASQSNKVRQYPAEIYRSPDSEAKINCSHNDNTFTRILWYKQSAKDLQLLGYIQHLGETMTLIVHTVFGGQAGYGGNPQTKYSAYKDSIEASANTVQDLHLDDIAGFFCDVGVLVLVIFRFIRDRVAGAADSAETPDVPLPRHLLQLLRVEPKAFPGQPRDIVPPACPGSSPGPPPGGTCLEHLPRKASRRHPV